jgi:FkbM family methyltransferase
MFNRRRREIELSAVFGAMRCFEDDLLTEQLRSFGAHTRPELAFLLSVVERGDRIFDLGAHLGTFSIPLGRRIAPTGAVVAVEGHEDYFDLLCTNVSANGLDGTVTPVNALLATPGSSYVASHKSGNSGATRFVRRRPWQRATKVPICSIDDLAEEYGLPVIVKIDIEGLELTVLEASDVIKSERPILYTEVSPGNLGAYSRTVPEFSDFLEGLGYRLFRNAGKRNAAHDRFKATELRHLSEVRGRIFDVLAVPTDNPRLGRVCSQSRSTLPLPAGG